MNVKPIRTLAAAAALTAALAIPAQAKEAPQLLTWNGSAIAAVREGDTICSSFRALCEAAGYQVDWVQGKAVAAGALRLTAVPGQRVLQAGEETLPLPVAVSLRDSRTIVPVRALAKALGLEVRYDPKTCTATILSPDQPSGGTQKPEQQPEQTPSVPSAPSAPSAPSEPSTSSRPSAPSEPSKPSVPSAPSEPSGPSASYDENDVYWLARIIEAEAGGESGEGKLAVANVVLNRVASSSYPDTIYDVIFDTKYGTQFEPTSNGAIYNTPSEESIEAAKRALSGENNIGGALYFYNPSLVDAVWIRTNCTYIQTIGCHNFYA